MDTRMHADAMPDADRSLLTQPDQAASRVLEIIRSSNDPENEIRNGMRLIASSEVMQ
jgi:hypothetical protein